MNLFDAHCHLQDERLSRELDAVLARCEAAGVRGWMCCGSVEDDWDAVEALSHRAPQTAVSFGLHPIYLNRRSADWRLALRQRLERTVSGVGEIGLDGTLEDEAISDQEAIFEEQYALSIEMARTVSIHCRKAWKTLLDLLPRFGRHPVGFVVHAYSGAAELVEPLVQLNGYLSFAGTLTRTRVKRAHRAIRAVPRDRLLLESDAPDMPPMLADGSRPAWSEPAHLPLVLAMAARLREESPEALAEQLWENAQRLYGSVWPASLSRAGGDR